ncbi:MAG: M20/M25/M40 family metallo-hydrolase [Bacteroidaceae bacterium]|nr:M20/M25/M40 family metallo-hydrolase [Bacteroidaceae bacterium]
MNELMNKISEYVDTHADELISDLQRFLRQPSISTENIGMEECTDMLKEELDALEMDHKVLELEGAFPAIYGVSRTPDAKKKLVVYGHYDVQSPDPVNRWTSDPFSAEIRDGMIYARGATDDKGNLWANLMAARVLKEVTGKIPAGLKFFFEGEEEIGSPNLAKFFSTYSDVLNSDACLLCDRGVHESGRPQFYLGNKGLMEVEISCKRAKRDVHSGHAPLIPNAIWDLARLLNSMKNELDEITIDGYTDSVAGPSEEEVTLIRDIPYDLEQFKQEYEIADILGGGTDPVEVIKKLIFTPTCNISGIKGGWAGERGKTIVPCEAWVRLDMRLVKGMSIAEAKAKLLAFIEKSPFGPFNVKIKANNEPYQCPPSHELVKLSTKLATEVYGEAPVVWPLLDGSGPMCMFPQYLGGDVFIIGLGAPFSTANTHAPDENISIDQYLTAIKLMANIFHQYLE